MFFRGACCQFFFGDLGGLGVLGVLGCWGSWETLGELALGFTLSPLAGACNILKPLQGFLLSISSNWEVSFVYTKIPPIVTKVHALHEQRGV